VRVILGTNILVSGLLTRRGPAALLLDAWVERRFDLVTSELQLEEFGAVTRRPHVRALLVPAVAGRFVNSLRRHARVLDVLPAVSRSPDSGDDFLLAMAQVSEAHYLVTGDKRDLLSLTQHGLTQIVTARTFVQILKLG
jgi:putative PIN family toxin of toxin-antitoxin system